MAVGRLCRCAGLTLLLVIGDLFAPTADSASPRELRGWRVPPRWSLEVSDTGCAMISVAGVVINVSSTFSVPGPNAHDLDCRIAPDEEGWKVSVDRSRAAEGIVAVSAAASPSQPSPLRLWSLRRVYKAAAWRLLVNDTIISHSAALVGTWAKHSVRFPTGSSMADAVVPGARRSFGCSTDRDRGPFGAPHLWARESAGVSMGVTPLDDVFRVHAVASNLALARNPAAPASAPTCAVADPPTLLLEEPHFAIRPGSVSTMEWALYPGGPACTDFLCFVNSLRHDLGTDAITIPSAGFLTLRGRKNESPAGSTTPIGLPAAGYREDWDQWGPAEWGQFVKQQGPVISTDNEDWTPKGGCHCGCSIDGDDFLDPPLGFAAYLAAIGRQMQEARTLNPQAAGLAYMGTLYTSHAYANQRQYADAKVTDKDGKQVWFVNCSEGDGDLPLFFGTTTNAFGRMHFRFVDKVFDDYGLQGVMHDEFNVATVSYTFSAWE